MPLALPLLGFGLLSFALLVYLGYGLVRLLLPAEVLPYCGLLAPLLGLILLVLVGYYGASTVLNLRAALLLCVLLATVLNAVVVWRDRGIRFPFVLREHGWVWLAALLVYVLGVLPLLNYGYLTIIGGNWDTEFYLPLAEYLVEVPQNQIAEMPANPMRD